MPDSRYAPTPTTSRSKPDGPGISSTSGADVVNEPGGYSYGDSDAALRRLRLLATVFEACTRRFLERLPLTEPERVLDLGCGPGETTRLLARRFPDARVTGVDSSPRAIAQARTSQQAPAPRFAVADVTASPLPEAPVDLIYARLLLAHVRNPIETVCEWTRQLRPGGMVALEEIEQISTDDRGFREYLELAALPLRARGTEMDVGRRLAEMSPPGRTTMTSSTCTLQATGQQAAKMFALNLETLRRDPTVQAQYSESELDRIAKGLGASPAALRRAKITWCMRQLVLTDTGLDNAHKGA